jgi:hypothetical protein
MFFVHIKEFCVETIQATKMVIEVIFPGGISGSSYCNSTAQKPMQAVKNISEFVLDFD